MEFKKLMTTAAILAAMSFGATTASATTSAKAVFDAEYGAAGSAVSCFVCHTGTPGSMTAYGNQYKAAGGGKNGTLGAILAIDGLDADGDGVTNGAEIAAGTEINPAAVPSSSSGGGCVTSSVTTPLMMVLAMLSLGFFVRRKKD